MDAGYIHRALCAFLTCSEKNGVVSVPTLSLYPSNCVVTVFVSGGDRRAIVSDDGGALDEIRSHGVSIDDARRFLRQFCIPSGLRFNERAIFSPELPVEAVAASVLLVANASAMAAHHAVDNAKYKTRRDIRSAVTNILLSRFGETQVRKELDISGKSSKQHRFDSIVDLGNDRKLIVDTVVPEPASINAKIASHLDIRELHSSKLIQKIIYDDEESWLSADLRFLKMAADVVPFRSLNDNIRNIETMTASY